MYCLYDTKNVESAEFCIVCEKVYVVFFFEVSLKKVSLLAYK